MGQLVRQSTATVIVLGPFVDERDGFTANTNMVVGNVALSLVKHSDTFASMSAEAITVTASGGDNDMAHLVEGYYKFELTAGNVDTLGRLTVKVGNAGNTLPVWKDTVIVDSNTYDALVSGTAYGADSMALLSANALTNVAIAVSGANKIADHTLRRTFQNMESSEEGDTIDLDSLYGILARFFKVTTVGNVMTVYKSDGTTVLGTVALSTDANAVPVIGVAAV